MASFSGKVRGGSLNLRQSYNTSSSKLASIPNNTALTVETVPGHQDWFKTSYNNKVGYVLAQYVAVTADGGTVTVSTSSGSLNIRNIPNGSVIYTAAKGATLRLLECPSDSSWYRVSGANGTGWASTEFLTVVTYPDGTAGSGSGSGNGSGSGSGASDDFSDVVTTSPTINTYYTYNPDDAVAYAKAHSTNTESGVADPKRNTSFGEGASNACANFVHQCLLAGGARMFDGWCYKLSGIPSSWDSGSWTYTNKGRRRLLEKKWIERIPYSSVQPGDIIYTYYSDYKKRSNMNTPFNHVTIAITPYDASSGGCYVCGHTSNQNNKFKELKDDGIPCTYCYHVKAKLGGDGNEKAIDLTNGKSKAL